VGEDAVMGTTVTGGPVPTDEVLILTAPSVVVTVEAGVGSQTLPMILVDIGFQGSVANWSTQVGFLCLFLFVNKLTEILRH
jgi:vacuolar protein sorting-associated protein 13A/C